MASRIRELRKGQTPSADDYNKLVKRVNALSTVTGRNGIAASLSDAGLNIRSTIATPLTPTQVRRAITTEAAPAAQTITANLYDLDGVEQTSGDESGVSVTGIFIGGGFFSSSVPRLAENDDLFVVKLKNGSGVDTWYCITLFQAARVC